MNNNEQLRVGIIMAYKNHEKYVIECLDSIIEQNYKNIVIAVTDDGSDIKLSDIISNLGHKMKTKTHDINHVIYDYKGIDLHIYRHNKSLGVSSARNRSISILFNLCDTFITIDSDDKMLPNKISICVNKYLEDPSSIGIIYHDVLIYNETNDTYCHEYREPYSYLRLCQEDIICNSPLISKQALQYYHYPEDMKTAEDWFLWLQIATRFIIVHIPMILSQYRVTNSNTSITVPKEIWNENWQKVAALIQHQNQHA